MFILNSILNGIAVLMLTIVLAVALFLSSQTTSPLQPPTRRSPRPCAMSLPNVSSKPSRS